MKQKTTKTGGRPIRRALFAGLALVSLSGCGVNLFNVGPPPNLYDLRLSPEIAPAHSRADVDLMVEEPEATSALDTDRIMVRPGPFEVQYYAGARWSDRAPLLLQRGLVEAFEDNGAIGVARQTVGLRGDYALKAEMREFAAVIVPGSKTPLIRIRVNFKLLRMPQSIILASKTFETETAASSDAILSVVAGFQTASEDLLEQAVPWTLEAVAADGPQREAANAARHRGQTHSAAPAPRQTAEPPPAAGAASSNRPAAVP